MNHSFFRLTSTSAINFLQMAFFYAANLVDPPQVFDDIAKGGMKYSKKRKNDYKIVKLA